jgi:hypothetical protein
MHTDARMNKGAHQANLHEALISAKQKAEQKMQSRHSKSTDHHDLPLENHPSSGVQVK